ncbi:MAG: hypothetical protein NUW37_04890 [Planctomycetes bacterium]|nr:hypothetical protein [Planctomycetota bacterium]
MQHQNDERFECAGCGGVVEAPTAWRGRRILCPHCNFKMVLPASGFKTSPAGAARPASRRKAKLVLEVPPLVDEWKPRPADDPDDDDEFDYDEYYDEDEFDDEDEDDADDSDCDFDDAASYKNPDPFPFGDRSVSLVQRFGGTFRGTIASPGMIFEDADRRTSVGAAIGYGTLCVLVATTLVALSIAMCPYAPKSADSAIGVFEESRGLGLTSLLRGNIAIALYNPSALSVVPKFVFSGGILFCATVALGFVMHICGKMWDCADRGLGTSILVVFYVFPTLWVLEGLLSVALSTAGMLTQDSGPYLYESIRSMFEVVIFVVMLVSFCQAFGSAHGSSARRALATFLTPAVGTFVGCFAFGAFYTYAISGLM